jgi:hypothetical protein
MAEPIKLTLSQVIEAGRKAYLEGRLSAQGPNPVCRYRDPAGRPCVIGAALSDADATAFDRRYGNGENSGVADLAAAGLLHLEGDEEDFIQLQAAHDDWAHGLESAHEWLRKLLNIEEAA